MDLEIEGGQGKFLRLEDAEAQAEAEEAASTRRRRYRHMLLVAGCAAGVFFGGRLMHTKAQQPGYAWTEKALDGTWELDTVNGDPVGPDAESTVISQRILLARGKLQGETHLRGDNSVTANAMPFPDESVEKVTNSADGHDVTILWNGTYQLKENQRLELHIGKAVYYAQGTWDEKTSAIRFDHDFVLTYPGPVHYHNIRRSSEE